MASRERTTSPRVSGDPDRRRFVGACGLGCLALLAPTRAPRAAAAVPLAEAPRTQLVDSAGEPVRAASLRVGETYVFAYPYRATPVFVIALPGPAQGGVGAGGGIVAYSAICTHRLAHPTRQLSYIGYRPARDGQEPALGVIGCCAENSRYDPAEAARVVAGPAPAALGRVWLEHVADDDALHAVGVSDLALLQRFFDAFAPRLALEHPNGDATEPVGERSLVLPLAAYSERVMGC